MHMHVLKHHSPCAVHPSACRPGPLTSAGPLKGAHPTSCTGALCVYTTVGTAPLSAKVVVLSGATVKLALAATSVNCVFAVGPPAAGAGAGAASGCAPARSGCAGVWCSKAKDASWPSQAQLRLCVR